MSRPGKPPAHIDPAEQIASLLNLYRDQVQPAALARLESRVRELGLSFSADELTILAALDTPARVQEFLNTQVCNVTCLSLHLRYVIFRPKSYIVRRVSKLSFIQ